VSLTVITSIRAQHWRVVSSLAEACSYRGGAAKVKHSRLEYTNQLQQVSRQFFVYPQSSCWSTGVPLYYSQSSCVFYPLSASGYPTSDFPNPIFRHFEWQHVCRRFSSVIHKSILTTNNVTIVVGLFKIEQSIVILQILQTYSWHSKSWLKLASGTTKPIKVKNIFLFSISLKWFCLPTPACDIPNIPCLICSETHGIPEKLRDVGRE